MFSFFGMNVRFLRGMEMKHCLNNSFYYKVLISGVHFSNNNFMIPNSSSADAMRDVFCSWDYLSQ